MNKSPFTKKNVIIVIGGQYGSEAKGKHIQDICHENPTIEAVVRTGAPNAGHSMAIYAEAPLGEESKVEYKALQILPCGWTAENVKSLYVGSGAQIIPSMLESEYRLIRNYNHDVEVFVDKSAMIQTSKDAEEEIGGGMSRKVGSTSKGCGAALCRRISRNDPFYFDYDKLVTIEGGPHLPPCVDVTEEIHKRAGSIVIEGTQGCGLSLYHSGCYPYCTSRDTGAAEWLAEAGMSPTQVSEIHMVCRTYPIRVAGNSGPMYGELSWSHFFAKAGLDEHITMEFDKAIGMLTDQNFDERTLVSEACKMMQFEFGTAWEPFAKLIEFTTVTKLPRRIGYFDFDQFERAVMINRPTHIALEFCNYVTAEHYGIESVLPLMAYVQPVDGAPIKQGKITYALFELVCEEQGDKMLGLLKLIRRINDICAKYCTARVTHLGIARDATIVLK